MTAAGPQPPKISEILESLCSGDPDEQLSVHELLHVLRVRAFGFLILLFALPNGIPAPVAPGLSAILGLPLLLLSAQMVLRFPHPWLPVSWRQRSIRRADLAKMLRPAIPVMRRIERYLRPRWQAITGWRAARLLGLLMFWNAFLLSLPIPFGNLIPAWAVILAALGQISRDGALVIASLAASLAGTVWVGVLIWAGAEVVERIF